MLRWCKKCKRIVNTEKNKKMPYIELERCPRCGNTIKIKNKFNKIEK